MGVWEFGRENLLKQPAHTSALPHSHTPTPDALPSPAHRRWLSHLLLIPCLVALTTGCGEDFSPFIGEERPFTIWGYMDAGADTQEVRVFTIEERPGLDRAGPIDAVVRSTDLDTGEERQWHDAEVVFADSSVGHVFWSPFRAAQGHRYRLEVMRSDGATSRVEVTVPNAVDLVIDFDTPGTTIPLAVLGEAPRLVKVEVEYDTWTVPAANPWPPGTPAGPSYNYPVAIAYTDKLERTAAGWETQINMVTDFPLIKDAFVRNCLSDILITIRRVHIRLLVASEEWDPPGGVFDPEVLAEPGTFSNVENGFGFFGGGYSVRESWVPSLSALRAAGFSFGAPCSLGPADIPECQPHIEPCFGRD